MLERSEGAARGEAVHYAVVVAPTPTEPLLRLSRAWRSATSGPRRRAALVGVGFAWVAALLVAREGTARARLAALLLMLASAGAAVAWRWVERRRLREPELILRSLVLPADREGAERALRALSLVAYEGRPRPDGTSDELAQLHVRRAIAHVPGDRILARATRLASRLATLALVGAAAVFVFCLSRAWSLIEGADVLAARHGAAPVALRWLDQADVAVRPPEYLHESERHAVPFAPLALPYGTQITVRGVPLHAGRRLALSDGLAEVPFVDDGAGGVVARWSLEKSARLHVLARFGEVAVAEPDPLFVESIPDRVPTVVVEGAPRQVALATETEDLQIKYLATDDHGLREVHLVLRSGAREERRVLARLDGETRSEQGGYVLRLRDPFLLRSHAPVAVTVEAKDNDPLTGPKWGASLPLTLVPPDVGEPEARRIEALRRVRDALVDSLAWRLATPLPGAPAARATFLGEESRRDGADGALLEDALMQTYGGLRMPARLRATLVAQREKARRAVDAERRAPSNEAHEGVVQANERFALVVDAVIRGLGVRDAREASRQLADVADDLALGAAQARDAPGNGADAASRAATRMDAAGIVLTGGSRALPRLGALGRDLGEIIEADLLRVGRARAGGDLAHAEWSARDLAARLREPDPSFGSRGGGAAGRAGGESGGGRGTPGDEESSPDDVQEAFEEAAQEVQQLAQDHAGEIGKMEQALAGARDQDDAQSGGDEARRHAEAVREAARRLPSVGSGSDSWTSKGASARELAEQMARSLEEGRQDDAAQSGRDALGQLDEAKKMLREGGWLEDPSGAEQRRVDDTRRRLEAEQAWAEDQAAQARRRASERARDQLAQGGDEEEKLAERARRLAERGHEQGSLPEDAVESIEDAERAARRAADELRRGDADQGLSHQREAQRNLEAANDKLRGDDDDSDGSPGAARDERSDDHPGGQVRVPTADEHKGPDAFRRRVLRGLGQPGSAALKDAVQRYAEGLLR